MLVVLAAGMAKRYGGCKPLAPVGLHGEAVIDLTASDAEAAGFGDVVIIVGPQTGPAIAYHVRQCFPPRCRCPSPSSRCRSARPTPCCAPGATSVTAPSPW